MEKKEKKRERKKRREERERGEGCSLSPCPLLFLSHFFSVLVVDFFLKSALIRVLGNLKNLLELFE